MSLGAPGYRFRSLSELTNAELVRMLGDVEGLFVEFKSNLAHEGRNVAKAIASFANALGGWVLVGVDPAGDPVDEWEWRGDIPFVDAVRDCIGGLIDPLPHFTAATRTVSDPSNDTWDG